LCGFRRQSPSSGIVLDEDVDLLLLVSCGFLTSPSIHCMPRFWVEKRKGNPEAKEIQRCLSLFRILERAKLLSILRTMIQCHIFVDWITASVPCLKYSVRVLIMTVNLHSQLYIVV
jgi:hypothetical protein